MAIKTRAELESQLSTGGSAVTVERNFIKDLLDSLDLATEASAALTTEVTTLQDQIDALDARVTALETP